MEIEPIVTVVRKNWLTRQPPHDGFWPTVILVLLLCVGGAVFLSDAFGSARWMVASGAAVFQDHEYWRAWTALFAHGDGVHLVSNLLLFVPFAYFLSGYYHRWFFPLLGFVAGGLINLGTLTQMPEKTGLIGVSGVVYWMGAAWITLSLLIDHRGSASKRVLKAVGVSLALFMPQTYQPQVSYLAHFLGYLAGVVSALAYYAIARKTFLSAEVTERRVEFVPRWENLDESLPQFFSPAPGCKVPRPPLRACTPRETFDRTAFT